MEKPASSSLLPSQFADYFGVKQPTTAPAKPVVFTQPKQAVPFDKILSTGISPQSALKIDRFLNDRMEMQTKTSTPSIYTAPSPAPSFVAKVGEGMTPGQTAEAQKVLAKPSGLENRTFAQRIFSYPKEAAVDAEFNQALISQGIRQNMPGYKGQKIPQAEEAYKNYAINAGSAVGSLETSAKGLFGPTVKAALKSGNVQELEAAKRVAASTERLVSNLQVASDAKDFLRNAAQQSVGKIDEARRGVITWGKTQELADALGITAEDMLKRRKGQALNAEELHAYADVFTPAAQEMTDVAKRIKSGENSDEMLANFATLLERGRGLQAAITGVRSEAGRALNILKKPVKGDPTSFYKTILENLGGKEVTEEIAKRIAMMDPTDFVGMNKFIQETRNASRLDKVHFYWLNSILSGPATHVANITSNLLTKVGRTALRGFEAGVDIPYSAITGKERSRYFGEMVYDLVGAQEGMKDGFKKALFILKNDLVPEAEKIIETRTANPIKGMAGKIIGTPTRFLSAADEVFKSINASSSIYAQAYRKAVQEKVPMAKRSKFISDLIASPTDEMLEKAYSESVHETFHGDIGEGTRAVSNLRNAVPGLRYVLPFIKTPVKILEYGLEISPAQILKIGYKGMKKQYKLPDEVIEDLSRFALGSVISATTAYYAGQGKITGAVPFNKNEKDAFYREGKQPYSIKVGDHWVSYARFEPFATTIGLTADIVNNFNQSGEKDIESQTKNAIAAVVGQLKNKSYLRGLSDMQASLDDPLRYGTEFIGNIVSGFIPSALNPLTRTVDPYLRKPDGMVDIIAQKIPFASKTLTRSRDVWGRSVQTGTSGAERLAESALPIKTSKEVVDPVDKELASLRITVGFPDKSLNGFKLDNDHYDLYLATAGQAAKQVLGQAIETKEYQEMSAADKEDFINNTVSQARTYAKEKLAFSLFTDQMDIDIPPVVSEEKADALFQYLQQFKEFRQANNNDKRTLYIKNLDKLVTQ